MAIYNMSIKIIIESPLSKESIIKSLELGEWKESQNDPDTFHVIEYLEKIVEKGPHFETRFVIVLSASLESDIADEDILKDTVRPWLCPDCAETNYNIDNIMKYVGNPYIGFLVMENE